MQLIRYAFAVAVACSITAVLGFDVPAMAKPVVKTKYKSYSVPGTSPYALLSYMQRNGPNVNGSHALASTAASIHHKADFTGSSNCKIRNYKVTLSFTITLPKAKHASRMPKKVRSRWKQFASHARWHENKHTQIWIGCAQRIERKVRSLRAKGNCNTVWSKARALAKVELARCDRMHAAFDRKETARASRIPLIAQALRAPKAKSSGLRKSLTFRHSRIQGTNR